MMAAAARSHVRSSIPRATARVLTAGVASSFLHIACNLRATVTHLDMASDDLALDIVCSRI